MNDINIFEQLFVVAPALGLAGLWIYMLYKEKQQLIEKQNQLSEDYKEMTNNAIRVLTLADDKLSKNLGESDLLKEIHRDIQDIKDTVKKYK